MASKQICSFEGQSSRSYLWANRWAQNEPNCTSASCHLKGAAQSSILVTARLMRLTSLYPARVKCHNCKLLLQQVV